MCSAVHVEGDSKVCDGVGQVENGGVHRDGVSQEENGNTRDGVVCVANGEWWRVPSGWGCMYITAYLRICP